MPGCSTGMWNEKPGCKNWLQYMAGRLYWCAAGSSNDIFMRRFDGCKLIWGLLLPLHRLESIINLILPYSAMQKPILFPWYSPPLCRLWQVCEKCVSVCIALCISMCVCDLNCCSSNLWKWQSSIMVAWGEGSAFGSSCMEEGEKKGAGPPRAFFTDACMIIPICGH